MFDDLAQNAVNFALKGDWESAVSENLKILRRDRSNVDALNRLAKAYSETGDIKKARETAEKAIKIDPLNPIAVKCLEKWKTPRMGSPKTTESLFEHFIEEPGKTKMVDLINLGESDVVIALDSGDAVSILPHAHRVSVVDAQGKYIGRLPDDLSSRIRKLTAGGNKYKLTVKSADKNEVKIFIRELSRGKAFEDIASF